MVCDLRGTKLFYILPAARTQEYYTDIMFLGLSPVCPLCEGCNTLPLERERERERERVVYVIRLGSVRLVWAGGPKGRIIKGEVNEVVMIVVVVFIVLCFKEEERRRKKRRRKRKRSLLFT